MIAQALTLYLQPSNRYVYIVFGFLSVSSFAVIKFGPRVFRAPFSIPTTCLIAFVHIFNHNPVSAMVFFISLFLSVPRLQLPVPTERIEFTSDTKRSFLYILITFSISISCVYIGVKYHALAIISDGVSSCCNCVGILCSILADIVAKFPLTSRLSYGFKRTPVVADFIVIVILLSANFIQPHPN
jgi:hypothetical protein